MESRIVCVTTGNPLTMAACETRPERYINYHMAPPGWELFYGERAGEPERKEWDAAIPLSYKAMNGEVFDPGIVVLEDIIYTHDDLTKNVRDAESLSERTLKSRDRAEDLMRAWAKYGACILAGALPTKEEIQRAIDRRLKFGQAFITEAIRRYSLGQAGKAFHADYAECVEAWAKEFGVKLPRTMDSLDRVGRQEPGQISGGGSGLFAGETEPCPACMVPINPAALICRHCHTSLGDLKVNAPPLTRRPENAPGFEVSDPADQVE